MTIKSTDGRGGKLSNAEVAAKAHEESFEARFGDYWAASNVTWGAERIQRTVIGIAKELMLMSEEGKADSNRVGALKGAGELLMRMLHKYMPDLKAIDITGNTGQSHEDALAQLAFRIRAEEEAAGQLPAVCSDVPQNTH